MKHYNCGACQAHFAVEIVSEKRQDAARCPVCGSERIRWSWDGRNEGSISGTERRRQRARLTVRCRI